jgi:metal-responsive CopG/Arc/MetJ family transcriptional regulator
MRKAASISFPPDLLSRFDAALKEHGGKRSWVLQDCIEAYLELSARCKAAGVKRLHGASGYVLRGRVGRHGGQYV